MHITNPNSSGGSNFQVKITLNTRYLIGAGKMNSAGKDIRFIDSSTCSNMNYWIESGINTASTIIWVKVTTLYSGSNAIVMYYGNTAASLASNSDSTFDLFDNFAGPSLSSNWTAYSTASTSYSLSSGITVKCTSTSAYCLFFSKSSFSQAVVAEADVTSVSGYDCCFGMSGNATFQGYMEDYGDKGSSGKGIHVSKFVSFSTTAVTTDTAVSKINGIWTFLWPATGSESIVWPGGSTASTDKGISQPGSCNLVFGIPFSSTGAMSISWVRVRKYAAIQPSSVLDSEFYNEFIKTDSIAGYEYCANTTIKVPFTVVGPLHFKPGNVFTVQLSDGSGNFTSPVSIGTLHDTIGDTVAATIPSTVGYSFRVRVISSNPVTVVSQSLNTLAVPIRTSPSFTVSNAAQCLDGNFFQISNTTQNGTLYTWAYGDGDTDKNVSTNPTHSYSSSGNHVIKLYAPNINGCIDSAMRTVTVYPVPKILFKASDSIRCSNSPNFVFTNLSSIASGSITSYSWNFGDNGKSQSTNATHTYASPGTYTVTLKAFSDKGCFDSASISVTVVAMPVPGVSVNDANQCLKGNSFGFTNKTTGTGSMTYAWKFGDGTASTDANPVISYKSPGSYVVKLYATADSTCTDSITSPVSVFPAVKTAFSVNNSGQCQKTQNFSFADKSTVASGSITSWAWDFGDSKQSTSQNPSHTFGTSGTYKVTLKATSDNGCSDTSSMMVTVYAQPVAEFSANTTNQCFAGNSFTFDNSSTGPGTLKYIWKDGDNDTASTANLQHSYAKAGKYSVTLYTTTAQMCRDSVTQQVQVYPPVKAGFTINSNSECISRQHFRFTNTSSVSGSNLIYQWNFGDQSSVEDSTNIGHHFASAGIYKVELMATSADGCKDSAYESIKVDPSPKPFIVAGGKTTFCEGGSVILSTNKNTGSVYQWLDSGKVVAKITKNAITAINTGIYKVIETNDSGCTDTSSAILVKSTPLPAKPSVTKTGRLLSADTILSVAYQWYDYNVIIPGADKVSYFPDTTRGRFTVKVTDANSCTNTSDPYYFDVNGVENALAPSSIRIYPNPAHDNLYIDFGNGPGYASAISLTDMNGKSIIIYETAQHTGIFSFPVQNLPKGIYLLRITSQNETHTEKVEVE